MLVLIGSAGYAKVIEDTYRYLFHYSHQFGYKQQTGDGLYKITQSLYHKSDELHRHLIHPVPIGQKLLPPMEFGLIDLTIAQLANSVFKSGLDVCEDNYARLTLIMHYEHIQLTIKTRAKLVVPYSEEGIRELLTYVP